MRLVQFFLPGKGKRVGLLRGDRILDITRPEEGIGSSLDLIQQGKTAAGLGKRAEWLARATRRPALAYRDVQRPPSRRSPHLLIPLESPEIWAARPTGEPGADLVRAVFFKATAGRCSGPFVPLATRRDSRLTQPRPGIGLVLAEAGEVVALTGYLGLSPQDLLTHPLSPSHAETYDGCCALGPCLTTPDELGDIQRLQMRLALFRDGEEVFSQAFHSSPLAELSEPVARLLRDNACPWGTVLAVEAWRELPPTLALTNGDRLDLEIQGIGRLSNPVKRGLGVGG